MSSASAAGPVAGSHSRRITVCDGSGTVNYMNSVRLSDGPLQVVILDSDFGQGEVEAEVLEPLGYKVVFAGLDPEAKSFEVAADAAAVITQYSQISEAFFRQCRHVRAVVRYGVGLDAIDLNAARAHNVAVSGVYNYCTDEVADHTVALVLAAERSICVSSDRTSRGLWPGPAQLPKLRDLRSLSIGLWGFGAIARAVAKRLQPFGATLVANDPFVEQAVFQAYGVQSAGIDEVFGCDVVSIHVPANRDTIGAVGDRLLSLMPAGATLINVSRGSIVDEQALLRGLERGHPQSAALDVLTTEGPPAALARHEATIVTPHVGYYSQASLGRLRRGAAEAVHRLLTTEPSAT